MKIKGKMKSDMKGMRNIGESVNVKKIEYDFIRKFLFICI